MTKAAFALSILVAMTAAGSTGATAAQRTAASEGIKPSQIAYKRQALAGVHADAVAVLNALRRDPQLAQALAANPAGAQALLKAKGATRAESITVSPSSEGGAQRIRIIIKIDNVTIEIIIDL